MSSSLRSLILLAVFAVLATFALAQNPLDDAAEIVQQIEVDTEVEEVAPQVINDAYSKFIKVCGTRVYLINEELEYKEAAKVCYKLGGRLLAVNWENFKCFAWYLNKIDTSPVWIGSWNGDSYKYKGIALYGKSKYGKGAIAIPRQKKLKALCEKRPAKTPYSRRPKKTVTSTITKSTTKTVFKPKTTTKTETDVSTTTKKVVSTTTKKKTSTEKSTSTKTKEKTSTKKVTVTVTVKKPYQTKYPDGYNPAPAPGYN